MERKLAKEYTIDGDASFGREDRESLEAQRVSRQATG
jgi:hypothetical protein